MSAGAGCYRTQCNSTRPDVLHGESDTLLQANNIMVRERYLPSSPGSIAEIALPRRVCYTSSPDDWRDHILYLLLIDRFSDGLEEQRNKLNRRKVAEYRQPIGGDARWFADWASSGRERWQGGTLKGVQSKLPYLQKLGVTTIWLTPVFRQRIHLDTYHGYGIQDFLEVDARIGTREQLVQLVASAHDLGMRIILDIVFNHSGSNWIYGVKSPEDSATPAYTEGRHPFGFWKDAAGRAVTNIGSRYDGVWPRELQDPNIYTRAGTGDISGNDVEYALATHKRSDFVDFRDFEFECDATLHLLASCYKYWIAVTDCDGFRLDALKHVSIDVAREFCNTIKEFAQNLGKNNFLLVGEIAGGDLNVSRYISLANRNLDAALDIGEMKLRLEYVAKGLIAARYYFEGFSPGTAILGSHRSLGHRHVSLLEDHDGTNRISRFSTDAASDYQVAAGVALQFFTLGIPCIYYGMEQALAGPDAGDRSQVPDWGTGKSEWFLREAMFGPEHPRPASIHRPALDDLDMSLPGFGPFGTSGAHCFDDAHPAYRRIALMSTLRSRLPVLRYGRQYLRQIATEEFKFRDSEAGDVVAWSRILHDEETVCILNAHGLERRSAHVLISTEFTRNHHVTYTVLLNTAECLDDSSSIPHPIGSSMPVYRTKDGISYIEVQCIFPSELIVVSNYAE